LLVALGDGVVTKSYAGGNPQSGWRALSPHPDCAAKHNDAPLRHRALCTALFRPHVFPTNTVRYRALQISCANRHEIERNWPSPQQAKPRCHHNVARFLFALTIGYGISEHISGECAGVSQFNWGCDFWRNGSDREKKLPVVRAWVGSSTRRCATLASAIRRRRPSPRRSEKRSGARNPKQTQRPCPLPHRPRRTIEASNREASLKSKVVPKNGQVSPPTKAAGSDARSRATQPTSSRVSRGAQFHSRRGGKPLGRGSHSVSIAHSPQCLSIVSHCVV
jgi:hypothetical protein